jgi:CHAT domain-containing protein
MLFERIASANQGRDGERLLCLLHGPLEALPIEFLLASEPGAEKIVPLVLPGLPERVPGRAPQANELARWSLLGSPVGTDGEPRLPGARDELIALARLHGSEARLGADFDREVLADALHSREPLHVATHLMRGVRPEGRFGSLGLELSGGEPFTAEEILEAQPALPLVVLAACETAHGRFVDAEGLQGVARAFLESGTRNLIVTAWPIEDRAATEFSLELHQGLLQGEKPSEAAFRARRHLRSRGFSAAEWAAFRLLGRD